MKSQRRKQREEQRKRILDCARFLFAAQSFEDVTMADIAAKAGVARATVFNHFPSKRSLIEAITGDVFSYWAGMLLEALADELTPTATLVRTLFRHMGAGVELYYGFYRGVFGEIARMQVEIDEGSEAARIAATARERLAALLARGQKRGEIRKDMKAADLGATFECLSNGTIMQWLFHSQSDSLKERMERVATIFLDGATSAAASAPANSNKVRRGAMGAPEWSPVIRLPQAPTRPLARRKS
jgi:AcrR family transcriptional regulator